ncbi:pyridoxal phosphate-dependent transferase [Hyaloraphidium curvatum]|nr:pyridoxal phosphate-dependent transferase [Hyaloraphidium curvatum]
MGRNARLSTLAGGAKAERDKAPPRTDSGVKLDTRTPEKVGRIALRAESPKAPAAAPSPQHHRRTSSRVPPPPPAPETHGVPDAAPLFVLVTTYLSYLVLILFGHLRDFFGKIFRAGEYAYLKTQNGYAPLSADFENFYTRRMYARIRDVFNRPITGVPGRTVNLLDRVPIDRHKRHFKLTGKTTECVNLSSYNYLGFAQSSGPCADDVEETIKRHGVGNCSTLLETGTMELHGELEEVVARFVGMEAAVCFNMGFAVNSTTIPALVGKGCLIISDELNHSSIIFGARVSGASIRVFKHNSPTDLEAVVRDAIAQGQPRTHRPWKKILIIVEGLYSMEGSICRLPEVVEIKKKYGCYLYVDEAHSIGALGANGRGVCDYWGVDPQDVDILMGTFTKSFGAAGGYISGKKEIVDYLRLRSHSPVYAEPMPPFVVQQIITSMKIIMGDDGTDEGHRRVAQLARNAAFVSTELKKRGFLVLGDPGSPIIPVLLFRPANIAAFSRMCLERNIACVVVGYPATPLIQSRVRLCVSASHTIEDLKYLVEEMEKIGDAMGMRFPA